MHLFEVLTSAACYFIFNWQFFGCAACVQEQPPLGRRHLLWTFLANYLAFFLCSVLGLHLIVNWIVFFFLLFGETTLLLKCPVKSSFLTAMLGTQLGLATNILLRSFLALLLDVPLVAFDNSVTLPGNMKAYPVLLGFLLAGGAFWLVRRFGLLKSLRLVLQSRATLALLAGLLAAMQLYLYLNLLVYSIPGNAVVLKWWSMKSSVFVLVGQAVSLMFAARLGRLAMYRAESQRARQILAEEALHQKELQAIACTDPLTGCQNRAQAQKQLAAALAGGRPFCLCFADLDGLKSVNDEFGHEKGDEYLLAAARALERACGPGDALFRYGGDEFLLLLFGVDPPQAAGRLKGAQAFLADERRERGVPFPMALSYGVAERAQGADPAELIAAADRAMYRMKAACAGGPGV